MWAHATNPTKPLGNFLWKLHKERISHLNLISRFSFCLTAKFTNFELSLTTCNLFTEIEKSSAWKSVHFYWGALASQAISLLGETEAKCVRVRWELSYFCKALQKSDDDDYSPCRAGRAEGRRSHSFHHKEKNRQTTPRNMNKWLQSGIRDECEMMLNSSTLRAEMSTSWQTVESWIVWKEKPFCFQVFCASQAQKLEEL